MLVAAPGVIPPHMTVESDIVGERCDDETQSVTRGIIRGEVPESQLQTGPHAAIWPTLCPITSTCAVRSWARLELIRGKMSSGVFIRPSW